METAVKSLQGLYDKLRTHVDLLNENIEPSELLMVLGVHLFRHLLKILQLPEQMLDTFL